MKICFLSAFFLVLSSPGSYCFSLSFSPPVTNPFHSNGLMTIVDTSNHPSWSAGSHSHSRCLTIQEIRSIIDYVNNPQKENPLMVCGLGRVGMMIH
jgi:hypothetical protein